MALSATEECNVAAWAYTTSEFNANALRIECTMPHLTPHDEQCMNE
jgi:hypothetical protein